MALSATRVKALREPGRYSDGGGLHLYISRAGHKSWVLRITIDGRRRDSGLGGFPSVSLARAREKAAETRTAVAKGRDPLAEKRAPALPTFREAAHAVHEANTPRWRNARHSAGWIQTLERHAMPTLGNTSLDRIDRGDVLRVLTPIWTTRPETARRVRQRMRTGLRWAMAHGFVETNPAGEAIRRCVAPDAEGEGTPQGAALPGGQGSAGNCGGVPGLGSRQAVFPLPGTQRGPLRRGQGHYVGGDRPPRQRMAHTVPADEGRNRAQGASERSGLRPSRRSICPA